MFHRSRSSRPNEKLLAPVLALPDGQASTHGSYTTALVASPTPPTGRRAPVLPAPSTPRGPWPYSWTPKMTSAPHGRALAGDCVSSRAVLPLVADTVRIQLPGGVPGFCGPPLL